MQDQFGRTINYVRLSLTDRCNLRCLYCMPKKVCQSYSKHEQLTDDEIVRLVKALATLGINKVRLTGGEPLCRPHIETLTRRLADIQGIDKLALTTNGQLLCEKFDDLYHAGITHINVSIDSLQAKRFEQMTRGGDIRCIQQALTKALASGIVCKLNVVLLEGINDDEILDFASITQKAPIDVRFIELMPIGEGKKYTGVKSENIVQRIQEQFSITSVDTKEKTSGPATYIKLENALGNIGFISPMSSCFCKTCNRVRITTDGILKQCLSWHSDIDVKAYLRNGQTDEQLRAFLFDAIYHKPEKNLFAHFDRRAEERRMNEIGG